MSKETTILYRAVGHAEFEQIKKTGTMETVPNGLGGKFFAEKVEHAERWGELLEGERGFRIISVKIPKVRAKQLMRWENLDNIGPAVYMGIEELQDLVPQTVE